MPYGIKAGTGKNGSDSFAVSNMLNEPNDSNVQKQNDDGFVCPLRDETVVVRFIERYRGITEDSSGDFYGGMGSRSEWPLYVPTERGSSVLMNPLTKEEKKYFEAELGRDLSVYPKHGEPSFWMASNNNPYNRVLLKKSGLVLHLNNVKDYLHYKILLLHKDLIAGSLEELENNPRATQLFYMSSEVEESKNKSAKANMKLHTFQKYGEVHENKMILHFIIFAMDGREESRTATLDMMQTKVTNYIDNDMKRVKEVLDDPLLETKAMLLEAARIKKIVIYDNNSGYFYVKESRQKMCDEGCEPRLSNAAKWLNKPEQHDIFTELQRVTKPKKA